MDLEKWSAVAGIGGLALAATVYVFRDIIARDIFKPLGQRQGYQLLRLIVLCIFVLGLTGVAGYIWITSLNSAKAATKEAAVGTLTEALARLSGIGDYKDRYVLPELKDVCDDLSSSGKWDTWRADLQATWNAVQQAKIAISEYNARARDPIDLRQISSLLTNKGQQISDYLSTDRRPATVPECRQLESFHRDWNQRLRLAVTNARNELQTR